MPKVTVYNLDHKSVGELDLSDDIFGAKVNEDLFYDVLKGLQLRSGMADPQAGKVGLMPSLQISGADTWYTMAVWVSPNGRALILVEALTLENLFPMETST